ncbi:MAG: type I-U CRISPR-associated protein Cas7, partial [Nannocystaceae bacterium]
LFKVQALLDGNLRLRTSCDLEVAGPIQVTRPDGWALPSRADLEAALPAAIAACNKQMAGVTEVTYTPAKGKAKAKK